MLRAGARHVVAVRGLGTSVQRILGTPEEHVKRKVIIFVPERPASQHAPADNRWRVVFDRREKWVNPLMGWTSSADTLGSQTFQTLSFPDKDSAVAFVQKQGWDYEVRKEEVSKVNETTVKSYSTNFQWEGDEAAGFRRLRVETK